MFGGFSGSLDEEKRVEPGRPLPRLEQLSVTKSQLSAARVVRGGRRRHRPRETDRRRPGAPPPGCANTFTGKGRFFFTSTEVRSECNHEKSSTQVLTPEETMPPARATVRPPTPAYGDHRNQTRGPAGPPSDSSPKAGLFARALVGALARRAGVLPVLAFFALALWAVEGQAQTAVAVCSNTPVAGERIECTEDTTSTSDIDIDAVDVDIDTSVENESGIHAKHEGAGKIDVEVRSDTAGTIDTAGINAHGIHSEHTGTGDITINVQKTKITTTGDDANGVYVEHTGDGNINIDVLDGSNIDIQGGGDEYAIRAEHDGDGDIDVLVDDTTTNNFIEIVHFGVGASTVRVENSTIDSGPK